MTKLVFAVAITSLGLLPRVEAEFLYNGFLDPFEMGITTNYAGWNNFQVAHTGANTPNSSDQPFSQPSSPTITQFETDAFIIGGSMADPGRIYSISEPLQFVLQDYHSSPVGMVSFQFETIGTLVDFSSIKLVYKDAEGVDQYLSATHYIREYEAHEEPGRGFSAGNRSAYQWDLTGLDIQDYQIVWNGAEPSMSFRKAVLDTAPTYSALVPEGRTWTTSGSGTWSNGSNWQEGSSSVEYGNVFFKNTGNSTVNLDQNKTVGELIFESANDVTIQSQNGSKLSFNTGITTEDSATGRYTIELDSVLVSYALFDIKGGTVDFKGNLSGQYGLFKSGDGMLILSGSNTFGRGGVQGGLGMQGGMIRVEGINRYTLDTTIVSGTLVVAANAKAGEIGALGSTTKTIFLGADSETYENQAGNFDAGLIIDGNYSVGHTIAVAHGDFNKTLGAVNASTGALFSGTVRLLNTPPLLPASNVHFTTGAVDDKLTFSGAIVGGGSNASVTISGPGKVIYSGVAKTYANKTNITAGTLEIASDSGLIGNGDVTVASNGTLLVNGTLGGTGSLTLQNGSTIAGSGHINRSFTVGDGVVIAPGNSPGTLHTIDQTWGAGGTYLWSINDVAAGEGIGWSSIDVDGTLTITATEETPFTLSLNSLTLANVAGSVSNFDVFSNYDWLILTADNIVGFDSSFFDIDLGLFASYANLGEFSIYEDLGSIYLKYEAVPEPGTWAMMVLGGSGLLWHLRRRKSA